MLGVVVQSQIVVVILVVGVVQGSKGGEARCTFMSCYSINIIMPGKLISRYL